MAKRKRTHLITCPYCRGEIRFCDSERDHVPPKSLFPKPWPSDMITVRCCPECHDRESVGDELLKFMGGAGLDRPGYCQTELLPSIHHAISRKPWWLEYLRKGISQSKPTHFLNGSEIRAARLIPMGTEISQAVLISIRRIVMGILFHHHPDWNPPAKNFEIIQSFEDNNLNLLQFMEELPPMSYGCECGDTVFAAFWDFAHDAPETLIMVLSFYEAMNFVVLINVPNQATD
jgi:hypothetical protein